VADVVVFIVWDEVVRGRERRAIRVYNAVREYLEGVQKEGKIESFETGVFGPATPLGGFLAVRGTPDQLVELRRTKEFRRLMLRTRLVVEHLRVARALVGANLLEQIREYQEEVDDLDKDN
jgi:hypothetical protein